MKKYTSPIIELTKFDVEDVIMTAGPGTSTSLGSGTTADKNAVKADLTSAGYVAVEW